MCSGGARALMLDDGADLDVPFAGVSDTTRDRLSELLTPGTPLENPIDVWDGQADLTDHATQCLRAIVADDDTALAIAFTDLGVYDPAGFPESFATACRTVAAETDKLVAAATYASRQFQPDVMLALAEAGIPVLDGMRNAVAAAAGHAFAVRDFHARRGGDEAQAAVDVAELRARLADPEAPSARPRAWRCSGVSAYPCRRRSSSRATPTQRRRPPTSMGFPVVLKAAAAAHKSDVGGVRLGLGSERAVSRGLRGAGGEG